MHLDVPEAFEQIKTKGRQSFVTFLDKLSWDNKLMKQRNKERADVNELLENLEKTRQEWIAASTNYEFAEENELIDYYTYSIKAAQIKYDYLLKKVKEKGPEGS